MCGIAGIWHLNKNALDYEKLCRFTDALSHRGPDGSGYNIFDDVQLGLGHRRLSILDLSEAGKQPMNFAEGNLHITFNGEIYNFIEIREELKQLGYQFKTDTDTEVILAAYHKWNLKCFDKFNGMWAVAIYDPTDRTLLLCRDRFGVKPLYYTFSAGSVFAFASETIAFKNLNGFDLKPDETILARTIDNPVYTEGTGYTIWKGVNQLLAGHYMTVNVDTKTITQKRWFEIPQTQNKISYEDAKKEFFRLTKDAVKLRLRSDVPVAAALSGGLDSSSVYSMLYHLKNQNVSEERVNYKNIRGFVATFEGTAQDETEYAKAVVDHCKGEAEYIKTDFDSIITNIETSTLLFNDVTATPISVLSDVYKCMRKNNFIVSLDGHGADEMLYGYRSLVGMAIMQAVLAMDDKYVEDLSSTYLNMFHPDAREQESVKLKTRIENLNHQIGNRLKYNLKRNFKKFLPEKTEHFSFPSNISNPFLFQKNTGSISRLSDKPINLAYYNLAEKELAIDFYYRNIPYNMRDFDRAAMQHGIEIRMPFMDYRLVNFVFSLPMKYKVGKGFTKLIMRDAMGDLLPEKVSRRTLKIGMGAPLGDWFNNQLNSYLTDVVSSRKFLESPFWNGQKAKESVIEKCANKSWTLEQAQQFWNILNANIIL